MFPGPYLCYYDMPLGSKVRAAQEYIMEVVEDEGPFDGILGFSQGAALAASILLERERSNQQNPDSSIFKFAIFICATRPWDINHTRQIDVGQRTSIASYSEFDDVATIEKNAQGDDASSKNLIRLLSRYEMRAGPSIRIPSAHIMGGEKDPDMRESEALLALCEAGSVKVVNHESGHMIPRSQSMNDRMVDAIMWAIEKSKFQYL